MADSLTATIKHLNDHPTQVKMPPYQDYVNSQYEVASRTASRVKDLVDYGRSKKNSDQIRRRLELPETSSQWRSPPFPTQNTQRVRSQSRPDPLWFTLGPFC